MRQSRFCAALVCAALSAVAVAQDKPSDHGSWFLHHFGPAIPAGESDRRLLEEADRVFARVEAVADKKLGRRPRLLAIDKPGELEAQALPDGTILINLPLLRFCFSDSGDREKGRARLAFVLGHEMAHLAHDDSWHAEAFGALRRYGDSRLAEEARRWAEEPAALRQSKEFHADQVGLITVAMAGFPPEGVLGGRTDFLRTWSRKTGEQSLPQGASHAPFEERSEVLRARLRALMPAIPFFRFGVRLAQLGRFDDAIVLLQRVHRDFPSREVESNLGLAFFQRYLARRSECGFQDGLSFKLPVALDAETLVTRLRPRSNPDADCTAAPAVRRDLEAARDALESAARRDPAYAPGRLNLAAVELLTPGSAARSWALVKDSDDPRMAVVRAVAGYLLSKEMSQDGTDAAVQQLEQLAIPHAPGFPEDMPWADMRAAAVFNRARILQDRGRGEAAREAWEEFLRIESEGPFADEARGALLRSGVASPLPTRAHQSRTTPLVERLSSDARRRLKGAQRSPFSLGDLRGAFLAAPGLEALELRGVIEVIDELTPLSGALPRNGSEPGPARVVHDAVWGRHTRVYRDIAWDVDAGRIVRRVLFQPR